MLPANKRQAQSIEQVFLQLITNKDLNLPSELITSGDFRKIIEHIHKVGYALGHEIATKERKEVQNG